MNVRDPKLSIKFYSFFMDFYLMLLFVRIFFVYRTHRRLTFIRRCLNVIDVA